MASLRVWIIFVAFTEAVLNTPLGALSIVTCSILSVMLLREKLDKNGWMGCVLRMMGSAMLAINAPDQRPVTRFAKLSELLQAPAWISWGAWMPPEATVQK